MRIEMIITDDNNYKGLDDWLDGKKKVFVVFDHCVENSSVMKDKIKGNNISFVGYSDFAPNPLYESIVDGVERFRQSECDCIIAVGGGSAIDVAKCIKAYAFMPTDGRNGEFLKSEILPNEIPLLAMPTTAGTGSEATKYAVIYYHGKKQSITSDSLIPQTVLIDPDVIKSLPTYQRKSTMMDALCHAIESFWSINSTEESRDYSRTAITEILKNKDDYLDNKREGNAGMLRAAHIAGKAINISQTTAGHAMSYKITCIFGCAHGHATILCDRVLYSWMINNINRCIDPRGEKYLSDIFDDIGHAMGCKNAKEGSEKLKEIFNELCFDIPVASEKEFAILRDEVNIVRLKNNPIYLDINTIDKLYHEILNWEK